MARRRSSKHCGETLDHETAGRASSGERGPLRRWRSGRASPSPGRCASSRRRFSCSALIAASVAGCRLRGVMHGAFGICADALAVSPFSLPSVTMASVVNLQVLYSGQSRCFWLVGFSLRISTYLLRGTAALPSFGWSVSRADLYQLRFRCDGLANVRIDLRGVAFRIGA